MEAQRNYIFQTNLQTLTMGERSDSVEANTNGVAAIVYNEEDFDFTQKEDFEEELITDDDEELKKDDEELKNDDEELKNDPEEMKNDNKESKYKKQLSTKNEPQDKMKTEKEVTKDEEHTRKDESEVEATQNNTRTDMKEENIMIGKAVVEAILDKPEKAREDSVKLKKDTDTRVDDKIAIIIIIARCVQILIDAVSDSKSLIDSINSSKKMDNNLLRPVIKYMKQMFGSKIINFSRRCVTDICEADILTKRRLPSTGQVMRILQSNEMVDLEKTFKKRTQGEH